MHVRDCAYKLKLFGSGVVAAAVITTHSVSNKTCSCIFEIRENEIREREGGENRKEDRDHGIRMKK